MKKRMLSLLLTLLMLLSLTAAAFAEGENAGPVRVVFACEPWDTAVTVHSGEKAESIPPEADGSYWLLPGAYIYSASADGFTAEEAHAFTVPAGAIGTVTVNVVLAQIREERLLTAAAPKAAAQTSDNSCGENLTWTLANGTLTIRGTGEMSDYSSFNPAPWYASRNDIKKLVLENGVASIGHSAFSELGALTSATIPSSVTSIEDYAFYGCSGLTSVTIPASVTRLGESAFSSCSSLTSVTIPAGVTSLEDRVFSSCSSLASITIPTGITSIGGGAFSSCSSLTYVTIPASVTSIGAGAFNNCALTSVTIPASVTSLENNAFSSDLNLTEIRFLGAAPSFEENVFQSVTATAFYPGNDASWTDAVKQNYGGTITWICPPTITAQPQSVTAASGTTATFTASAAGGALRYQWQYYNTSSKTWDSVTNSAYGGLKTATMTVPATTGRNGLQFRCVVTNAAGTVSSNSATLTVISKPTITSNPSNATAAAGSTATFKVTATGATSYQWQYYNTSSKTWDSVTNSSYGGLKTATMTVAATTGRNGMQFRCAVTNAAGTTYSNSATLTVTSASKPVITAQPQDVTTSASTATFKVTATGATSYQWQYYNSSSKTWGNVTNSAYSGLKTATMTVPTAGRSGMQFRCAVTNAQGTTYSNGAKLTVTSASKPTITAQPQNVTTSASTATFKVTASGATSYQWQYYTGSGWANITNSSYSGLKTATMTVPTAGRSGMQFRCAVSNAAGTTYSNGATLTVASKPVITGQPSNVTASAGTTATFKVTASGATSYQWQYYNSSSKTWDNVTNSAYGGLKTATMTVPATTGRNGMQFRCAVTNAQGTTYSNGATLTVK